MQSNFKNIVKKLSETKKAGVFRLLHTLPDCSVLIALEPAPAAFRRHCAVTVKDTVYALMFEYDVSKVQ